MSPSRSAAYAVMPTVATSPSASTHSCSAVYLSSCSPVMSGLSLVEGEGDDAGGQGGAAHVDREVAGGRIRVEVGERDRMAEGGAERAARHLADDLLPREHAVAVPARPLAVGLEPDEHAAAVRVEALHGVAAHVVRGLLPAHQPAEAGLLGQRERRQLVAVERHARLEAERVPRRETDRHHAGARAGLEDRPPELREQGGGDEELVADLAGVAGAGGEHRMAPVPGGEEAVVAELPHQVD